MSVVERVDWALVCCDAHFVAGGRILYASPTGQKGNTSCLIISSPCSLDFVMNSVIQGDTLSSQ